MEKATMNTVTQQIKRSGEEMKQMRIACYAQFNTLHCIIIQNILSFTNIKRYM